MVVGCPGEDPPPPPPEWQLVHEDLPAALLSVWGTSESDVWTVGGDARDGTGPLVLHYDGDAWKRVETGLTAGDLWWVFGFADGPVFMGGAGGVILRYDGGAFTSMTTPGIETVFGIWGSSPTEMWAVGGGSDATGGFVWRLDGDSWAPEPTLPAEVAASAAIWKVFGTAPNEVWFVGSNGVSLRWDGATLVPEDTGVGSSLFTVHANSSRAAAVGGLGSGIIVEHDGTGWHNVTPGGAVQSLSGVALGDGDFGVAVGGFGGVFVRDSSGWHEEDTGLFVNQNLHAVWLDPSGAIWAAGGQTFSLPLTDGVLMRRGDTVVGEGL